MHFWDLKQIAAAPAAHQHYESNNVNEVHRVRKRYSVTHPTPSQAADSRTRTVGDITALSTLSSFLPCLSPPQNIFPRRSFSCQKPTLQNGCPAGLYGSKKNAFGVLVAPSVRGCSTLPARPLAIPLMK
jgi:hypothetical protein